MPSAGDLLGFNIYKNNLLHNSNIVLTNSYLVDDLTNGTEYSLGVTAVYFESETENIESSPATILATPNFIYGDIVGTVSDPNGTPVENAIVSTNGASDTTGSDGMYMLLNLTVGLQEVTVTGENFGAESASVSVLAQAEPTVQNFTLYPELPSPSP